MSLKVIKAGILDSAQDSGRYGYQQLGINPGGAMDKFAAQISNILVGNKVNEAIIEIHSFGQYPDNDKVRSRLDKDIPRDYALHTKYWREAMQELEREGICRKTEFASVDLDDRCPPDVGPNELLTLRNRLRAYGIHWRFQLVSD